MVKIGILVLGLAGVGLGGLIQPAGQTNYNYQRVRTQGADHSHEQHHPYAAN